MVKKPTAAGDAEADERRRLRSLAFSNGLLQRGEPAVPRPALAPSSTVARLQGRDIVRRGGQCKSRFVFSFPGLLAPAAAAASGGRVGELADLGSKNPVLYLELPQMKSPEVKKESQSEDIKPADPSVHSLYSKEPLVQATLSSLFKKEEEKKRYTRSPKRSPATKGPAAKKQRASPKETQPAGKSKVSGTRKKQKPKVDEDEIEQLSSSSQCTLGIVLLQNSKERLKEISVDPNIFDRFALLNDSDADFTNSGIDSGMVRPNEDQQTPIGCHEEVAQSQKKGKMSERR